MAIWRQMPRAAVVSVLLIVILHVIAGMVVLSWLIRRSLRGDFGTKNFTAVDLGGLYWHLVDLIWIFLFPLLYLIH